MIMAILLFLCLRLFFLIMLNAALSFRIQPFRTDKTLPFVGYVCSALSINPWSHCCPTTGDHFSERILRSNTDTDSTFFVE
jgi:hypothetical protein